VPRAIVEVVLEQVVIDVGDVERVARRRRCAGGEGTRSERCDPGDPAMRKDGVPS
jgi:hypothetical protein